MNLTVEEALTIFPLSQAKVVAGGRGITRPLRSVNVIDCPDFCNWVKDGELLFTTAFVIKDQPEQAIQMLHHLNERGASGLGIKIGRFWQEIPQEVVDAAEKLDFPILALPYEFTFSDQMDALFQAEHVKVTKKLHGVLDKQKQLIQFALRQMDLKNMYHMISGILACPMTVISKRGNVLFNNTAWTNEALLIGWPWNLAQAQWVGQLEGRHIRIPMQDSQGHTGYLMIFYQNIQVTGEEEALFHQAAEIISFHLGLDPYSGSDPSRHQKIGELIQTFFRKEISVHELSDACVAQKVDVLTGSYVCVFTRIQNRQQASLSVINEIRQELIHDPALKSFLAEHVIFENGLLSIYGVMDADPHRKHELFQVLKDVIARMNGAKRYKSIQAMVSGTKMGMHQFEFALSECMETQRIADQTGLSNMWTEYEAVELLALFEHLPIAVMQDYTERLLDPLFDKDRSIDPDLIHTLDVFMSCNASVNDTSRILFVHRNTVAYRLEKIGELLRIDLKKTNDLLRLKLAYLFRGFLERGRSSGVSVPQSRKS